ncbi:TIGR02594 family protein [Mesorhizobium australicum]|uniref:TIGR02594 family protein n=1 Tax=Mesorhizobium australicum TaxID=536018 RepID=UPI0033367428
MDFISVNETILLRSQPVAGSPPVELAGGFPVRVYPEDVLVDRVDDPGGWSGVVIDRGGGTGPKGYIKTTYIVTKSFSPKDLKQADFTNLCAIAAVTFNVDLAYLMALARTESGIAWNNQAGVIKASIYTDAGASGPFQFIRSTWDSLIKQVGTSFYVRSIDIIDPISQAVLAAYLANDGINRHQAKFGGLPSPAELYLYHLFGWPAATKVLAGKGSDRIDALLMAVYEDQAKVTAILKGNASLLMSSGLARTLDGVLDEVAGRLFEAYSANAALLANPQNWWPLSTAQPATAGGPTPWLQTAAAEIGQAESPGPTNNPRISEYLSTVGFAPGRPDETAWCAAFVCWSLQNSGDATAIATAKKYKSSFAAEWLKLPNVLLEPAPGAIGITKAYSADTTGHVGFVKSVQNGKVLFLAGNQKPAGSPGPEQVCEKDFPRSDFVGFRWV